MLIGTAIAPGIGTFLGGTIGIAISAYSAYCVAEARCSKNYMHILTMSAVDGRKYAELIYREHQRYLSSEELKSLMRKPWPS